MIGRLNLVFKRKLSKVLLVSRDYQRHGTGMAIWEAETFLMSLQLPPYTYSERSIPYLENPDAYHTGTFNKSTYFNKIDAIKDGDLSKLNSILESEGIKSLSRREFRGLEKQYSECRLNI